MHKYLRAIGFSEFKKKDLEIVIKDIIDRPEIMRVTRDSDGNEYAELSREFGTNIGLKLVGNYIEDDSFQLDNYYPYFTSDILTTEEKVDIEKHYDKESYAGLCDDIKLGVVIIFHLQNAADYLSETRNNRIPNIKGAYISGLSTEGKILLPMKQTIAKEKEYSKAQKRNELITQAIDGNQEAIENLTLQDMDTYSLLSKRIMKEDILSIVSTSMVPFGIENDLYNIIAEITDVETTTNSLTNENIYLLYLKCKDLSFAICINEKDLIGEPAVGRRFKGSIWMQGTVNLE